MKREILFRGKYNKDWVWGSLIISAYYDYAIFDPNKHDDTDGVPVEEDTIGQCLPFTDRNGKRIFEDDIVKFHYFYATLGEGLGVQEAEHELIGVIKWSDLGWAVAGIRGQHWEGHTGYEAGEGEAGIVELYSMNEGAIHEDSFEVIGNIYDNPELLG